MASPAPLFWDVGGKVAETGESRQKITGRVPQSLFRGCRKDSTKLTKRTLLRLSKASLGVRLIRGHLNLPFTWSHSATSRSSSHTPIKAAGGGALNSSGPKVPTSGS
ncbi:uncharacterized protein PS065_000688 [Dugong dugon]